MTARLFVMAVAFLAIACSGEPPLSAQAGNDYRLREAREALAAGDAETAWFRLWDMAIEGHAEAQVLLARLYRDGRGIPADPRLERRWIEHAATSGHPLAQYRLGELYEASGGEAVNRQAAALWYERSAAQGHAPARRALERLRGQLASPK